MRYLYDMAANYLKFAFLGAGNIANAIISGLVSKKLVPSPNIYVYDLDKSKYHNNIMQQVNCCETMHEAVEAADIVLFALKPSVISSAIEEIKTTCKSYVDKTYISVAAAVSSDFIANCFNASVAVIRTMPNTPLLLGQGAVAVSKNRFVNDKVFQYICRLFSNIAEIAVIQESLMNKIISVNGSSPAYVYLFYKAMLDAAIEQGIPVDKAAPLILQSIKGAVKMIEQSSKDVDTLIKDVSSPNGTTLAALSVLYTGGFTNIVFDAMMACTARAEEMAKEIEQTKE